MINQPLESPRNLALSEILLGITDDLADLTESHAAIRIRGLQHDSRKVRPGDLFVALNGVHSHGLSHLSEAINNQCVAVIYDPQGADLSVPECATIPCLAVPDLPQKLGGMAARFFAEPSHDLDVVGITGTNGKTSCSHFLATALGTECKAAVIGTLGWGSPGQLEATTHTTPDAIENQRILSQLREEGYQCLAMEASSHGLVQGRLNGVRFKGALYTNFSRDHLDYHGTMAAYLDAKLHLLDWPDLEFVVFNADDPIGDAVLNRVGSSVSLIGFSVGARAVAADFPLVSAAEVSHITTGLRFELSHGQQTAWVEAPVFGDFNVENLVATAAVLMALGRTLAEAAAAVSRVSAVPGRMENIGFGGRNAIIDYAHTPEALASVLKSLARHCIGRLCVVFGCGGDRDKGKRQQMGAIADQYADLIVLTDDNPRNEDGNDIIALIREGISATDVTVIRDRRAAIDYALAQARPDDIVLIAGKGHETTQEILGHKYPFSDRAVAVETLERLYGR
ncbi:MAG: UDP-N-acetylmuramoyl-L-alanyl-D-glutamate--2,6-diaminopimelate ligase [Methylococcaceae bacterium]